MSEETTYKKIDIAKIKIDSKSRDDIPQILKGLQFLYVNAESRNKLFKLLEEGISPQVSHKKGRPGMDLWKILVLGVVKVNLNTDYDRLQELANNHIVIRAMLGHPPLEDSEQYYYKLQVLKDNIRLLTPELLSEINQLVVKAGHQLLKKKTRNL
jgi:hypothetical protein